MTVNPDVRNQMEEGQTIKEPSDLKKFVRKDPTDGKYYCTLCSHFSQIGIFSSRNHVESSHFPKLFTYHCDMCDGKFSTKSNYVMHKSRKHSTKRMAEKCDYTSKTTNNIQIHTKEKHEGASKPITEDEIEEDLTEVILTNLGIQDATLNDVEKEEPVHTEWPKLINETEKEAFCKQMLAKYATTFDVQAM